MTTLSMYQLLSPCHPSVLSGGKNQRHFVENFLACGGTGTTKWQTWGVPKQTPLQNGKPAGCANNHLCHIYTFRIHCMVCFGPHFNQFLQAFSWPYFIILYFWVLLNTSRFWWCMGSMWWLNGKLVVAFPGATKWQPYRLLKQAPLQNDNLALFSSYPPYKTSTAPTPHKSTTHPPKRLNQGLLWIIYMFYNVLPFFIILYYLALLVRRGMWGHWNYKMTNLGGAQTNTPTKWQTCGVCEQPPLPHLHL